MRPAGAGTMGVMGSGLRVLVMDKSALSAEASAQQLALAGFEVRTAGTHREFDAALARWWPDVAIIELNLRDADGGELCRELKRRVAVRVILFSSADPDVLAARARACGADGYLSKRMNGYRELPRCVRELCEAAADAAGVERRRVLLFDDSPLSLEFEATLLGVAGFEVRSALTLPEFDRQLLTWRPELILTDVDMPDIKGGELCKRLKADMTTARIPVVLFSALPRDELERIATAAGADAALSKADGYEQLGVRLQALCDEIIW